MRKIIAALVAAFFVCAPMVSRAGQITKIDDLLVNKPITVAIDRVQDLTGQNPQSLWRNLEQRDTRIGIGTYWWAALCGSASTCPGSFTNLSILPVTGLYVAVGPTVTNSVGALYQFLPEETTPYGGYPSAVGLYLPADSTQVMLQGLASTNTSNIGPLTPPSTTGQSINYNIECAVTTYDTTSTSVNIVSPQGSVTSTSANRDRKDGIACQSKAGVAATTGSQTTPAVDSGYTSVGSVAVPYGTVTLASGNIIAGAPFSGFAQASPYGANAVVLSPSSRQSGTINVSGAGSFGGAISGTTGSFSGAITGAGYSGGPISGTSGSFSGAVSGASYSGGAVNGTSGTFSGAVSAGGFTGGAFSGTTGTFSGAITGAGYSGGAIGGTTGSFSGAVTGASYSGGAISGSTGAFSGTLTANGGENIYGQVHFPSAAGGGNVISSDNNYMSLQGFGGSTGVALANTNTSGSSIAIFVLGSTTESSVSAAGVYSSVSDRRLKKHINYAPKYGISTIDALKPVEFDWRSTGKHQLGFIAQDVLRVVPTAVSKHGKYYQMSYTEIIPILVRGMQQQQAEIKNLQRELAKLRR